MHIKYRSNQFLAVFSTALLALGSAKVVMAQGARGEFAIDRCEPGTVGPLRADGRIGFLLQPNGKVDTATIRVLEANAISVAGFASAASRFLGGCRFRVPRPRLAGPTPVEGRVEFRGDNVLLEPVRAVDTLSDALPAGIVLIPTQDLPLAGGDRRIEESPMPMPGCRVGFDLPAVTFGRTAADVRRRLNAEVAEQRGNLRIEVEIDRGGRVVEGSILILSGDNPKATESFIKQVKRCRFTPARIGGIPIPFTLTMGRGDAL